LVIMSPPGRASSARAGRALPDIVQPRRQGSVVAVLHLRGNRRQLRDIWREIELADISGRDAAHSGRPIVVTDLAEIWHERAVPRVRWSGRLVVVELELLQGLGSDVQRRFTPVTELSSFLSATPVPSVFQSIIRRSRAEVNGLTGWLFD
jgi:hypothetical protein